MTIVPPEILSIILEFTNEPSRTERVCRQWHQLSDCVYKYYLTTLRNQENAPLFDEAIAPFKAYPTHKKQWVALKDWGETQQKIAELINFSYKAQAGTPHQRINSLLCEVLKPTL